MVPAVAAAPLAVPAVAAAAPAAAGGVETLGALVKMFGVQGVIELLTGQVAKSTAPGQYATAPVGENRSNYFTGANTYLAREQNESRENFNRRFLRSFGVDIPDLKPTSEVMREIEQQTQREAKSLTAREMQKISLEGTLAQQLASLQGKIGLERAGLERGYDVTLKGYDLEQEKQKQIGAIEQQKVSSTFDAAQRLLDSTITQIYGATPYARNPDLQQIATPV
jgi:hypothetical protein